jgi:hypothetical protein
VASDETVDEMVESLAVRSGYQSRLSSSESRSAYTPSISGPTRCHASRPTLHATVSTSLPRPSLIVDILPPHTSLLLMNIPNYPLLLVSFQQPFKKHAVFGERILGLKKGLVGGCGEYAGDF